MSPLTLYLVLKLDTIITATTIVSVVLLALAIVSWLLCADANEECLKSLEKTAKKFTAWSVVLFSIAILTPSTKDFAIIYVVPKLATETNLNAATTEAKELYSIAKQAFKDKLEKKSE